MFFFEKKNQKTLSIGALGNSESTPSKRPGVSVHVTIRSLGSAGDGTGITPDGATLHIPRALPGETIEARATTATRAICERIESASPDRVQPPCPHFEICGGCALQHLADAPYAAWKSSLVANALSRAGFNDPTLAPLVHTPPAMRRRLDFGAHRTPSGVTLGLHGLHDKNLFDVLVCPVLHPALVALLAPLRALLPRLDCMRRRADILATLYDSGPDLLLRMEAAPTAADRTKLAAFATTHALSRISISAGTATAETSVLLHPSAITFGSVTLSPPPGAFLQASAAGEAAIVSAVLAGLPARIQPRSPIIELYAGIGTLTFPLATRARVQAFEGDEAAAATLRRAAGGTRVVATHRDLTRQPLQKPELSAAAAVVLDPPFAGAALQMSALATAGVATIIYVSCNPAALARDVALLYRAGYGLVLATPIDQFLWSAQVEAVCVFKRK
jgi:23S rRNA (uracil1939-C5)-methyltransferase